MDFSGKKILVTGASSGIGRACALRLVAAGAQVLPVGRNVASLSELRFAETQVYTTDVTDEAAIKGLVARLKAEVGSLDGCVLAAGVHSFRPLMLESFASVAKPWGANVQSNLALLGMLLRSRLIAKGGSIVLFSSAAAHIGGAGAVSYASSKGAIESATTALAVEVASQQIRVNAVAPGVVRTPMSDGFLARITPEQLALLEGRHPMGLGSPDDVAGPVLFLLSNEARWVTGAVLRVDGGYAVA